MKASAERKLIRWLHIIFGIPIIGYIYGPISENQIPTMIVRFIIFPLLVLSGLYMWKGYLIKNWIRKQKRKKSM